ncbi:MAG: Ig-like domain-containing protein [Pyrinomonadaceae bacterium]|nr:Ig-like domain-containing protein [Sphingobacteriaceae bacterium]
MRNLTKSLFLITCICTFWVLAHISGCASIQRPTGGPKDSLPPKILKENPKNFTTNFKGDEVEIDFDEYFKLTDEFKEISVSPAMEKSPNFKVKKKTLNIQFNEPLLDSTTYTINFGKSIADYNEGNKVKNYMYVLSTGNKIDSLQLSGTVLNTLTKKPVLDATVFILPVAQDSLFGKKRASIFTTTDSSGVFKLKYLREGTYNIYALKEEGGDRIFNSANELIGFLNNPVKVTNDTTGNLSLELFKENPKIYKLLDRKIEKDGRITFISNKQLKNPGIEILNPADLNATKVVEFSATKDTALLWAPSMEFDSINVVLSDDKINIDTVVLRRNKKDTYNRLLTISDNIPGGKLKPGEDISLTLSAPIKYIDGKKFSLLQDSVPVTGLRVSRDSLSTRKINIRYPWKDEKKYILTIADDGFTGTFGGANKVYTKQFTKDIEENYGVLTTKMTVPDTSKNYIVQLYNSQEKLVSTKLIKKNTSLNFPTLGVGKYFVRIIYDANKNGVWDTGNVRDKKQPEKVWNYSKEIGLRANFDVEEAIAIPKDE